MNNLPIDVASLNKDELAKLSKAVTDQLEQHRKKEFDLKKAEIIRLAAEINLEISFPGLKEVKRTNKTGSVAPKFQCPNDPTLTWTGRGRKPLWVDTHLQQGGTLEALMIKN